MIADPSSAVPFMSSHMTFPQSNDGYADPSLARINQLINKLMNGLNFDEMQMSKRADMLVKLLNLHHRVEVEQNRQALKASRLSSKGKGTGQVKYDDVSQVSSVAEPALSISSSMEKGELSASLDSVMEKLVQTLSSVENGEPSVSSTPAIEENGARMLPCEKDVELSVSFGSIVEETEPSVSVESPVEEAVPALSAVEEMESSVSVELPVEEAALQEIAEPVVTSEAVGSSSANEAMGLEEACFFRNEETDLSQSSSALPSFRDEDSEDHSDLAPELSARAESPFQEQGDEMTELASETSVSSDEALLSLLHPEESETTAPETLLLITFTVSEYGSGERSGSPEAYSSIREAVGPGASATSPVLEVELPDSVWKKIPCWWPYKNGAPLLSPSPLQVQTAYAEYVQLFTTEDPPYRPPIVDVAYLIYFTIPISCPEEVWRSVVPFAPFLPADFAFPENAALPPAQTSSET